MRLRRRQTLEKAAITFLFLFVNGVWVLMAYLLHMTGVSLGVIAVVIPIGVVLGNLAAYAGVKLAEKLLRKVGD
jgi:hypothetical protein